MANLSIIIINWNSADYVMKCIQTIQEETHETDYEIIVVDNASFDGCGERLSSLYPEVVFIQSQENLGFARGNNLGAKHASGSVLLFLNPDTEIRYHAIDRLYNCIQNMPDCGVLGCKLLNRDGSIQTSCVRALPTPLNQAVDSDFLRRIFSRSSLWGTWEAFSSRQPCEVQAISGACMLLKSDVFQKVGGFSSEYFMYTEDMDLCFKVWRIGLKIYHVPNAVIVHYGGGSSKKQTSAFSIVRMRESNYIYMLKNHGLYHARLYRFLQGFSALVRLGIMVPFLIFSKDSKRMSLRYSVQKWVAILKWALKDELNV